MGAQKSSLRGTEFLPAKVAGAKVSNMGSLMARPDLNTLLKHAMEGTISRVDINAEVARQMGQHDGSEKTASAEDDEVHVSTEQVEKLAAAVGYIAEQLAKEADQMEVSESAVGGSNIDAGQMGQATSGNQPPMTPALQGEKVQSGAANTGLETNDAMKHPAQPVEPIKNEKTAEADPESHFIRRHFLGTPISAAIEAERGKKLKALASTGGHGLEETLKGTGIGAVGGTAAGALYGLAAGPQLRRVGMPLSQAIGTAGILGAGLGAGLGGLKGKMGREASRLHGEYSKHKKTAADEDPEGHKVRRFFLGNPVSAAIEAEKGKKLKSFGRAAGHSAVEQAKGMGIGGVGGAGLGAAIGAAVGAKKGIPLKRALSRGAVVGGLGGAYAGGVAGSTKGQLDRRASEIHGE
jgi:hypothetical protein